MLENKIKDEYLAAFAALGSYPAWRKYIEYLEYELSQIDIKSRRTEENNFRKFQGAAVTLEELIKRSKEAPTLFKNREQSRKGQ